MGKHLLGFNGNGDIMAQLDRNYQDLMWENLELVKGTNLRKNIHFGLFSCEF